MALHAPDAEPDHWPPYCCAILQDVHGRYLMERRPASAKHAAGLLTCFGGGREAGEEPLACLRRELREELGLTAAQVEALGLDLAVVIRSERRLIAWFFAGRMVGPGMLLRTEAGFEAVWRTWKELATERVSPWHTGALTAHRAGLREAVVGEPFA